MGLGSELDLICQAPNTHLRHKVQPWNWVQRSLLEVISYNVICPLKEIADPRTPECPHWEELVWPHTSFLCVGKLRSRRWASLSQITVWVGLRATGRRLRAACTRKESCTENPVFVFLLIHPRSKHCTPNMCKPCSRSGRGRCRSCPCVASILRGNSEN